MGPAAVGPIVLLVLVAACLVGVTGWSRARAVRAGAAALAVVLGILFGLLAVNRHYGYYRTWHSVWSDAFGAPAPKFDPTTVREMVTATGAGRVVSVQITGRRTHLKRDALVYLPPQYETKLYRNTRFPVVELLHGSPGQPSDWVTALNVATAADLLIRRHLMGPLILVMPRTYTGRYQDCVNGTHAADETYLNDDVRTYIRAHFRASASVSEWGVAGYSSGGFCAMNLAFRHRDFYGAAAAMDGYFRAADGPAAGALSNNPTAIDANSPLSLAQRLRVGASPMPALWLSAGTANPSDQAEAQAFLSAVRVLEQVTYVSEPGAGHNFYAWAATLPSVLAWMWAQLAPPDLKVDFPILGPATTVVITPGTPRPLPIPTALDSGSPTPVATITVTLTATPKATPTVTARSSVPGGSPQPTKTPTPSASRPTTSTPRPKPTPTTTAP